MWREAEMANAKEIVVNSKVIPYLGIALLYCSIPLYYWVRTGQVFPVSDILRPAVILSIAGVLISMFLGFVLRNRGTGVFASVIPAVFFLVSLNGYIAPVAIILGAILLLVVERSFDYEKLGLVILFSAIVALLFPAFRLFDLDSRTLLKGNYLIRFPKFS